jgi:predicted PurR-regulated permease PerM
VQTISTPHLPKRTAIWVTLGFLVTVTAYLAFRIAEPYLEALLVGTGLATLFYPLHLRLCKHVTRPSLAALVSTVLVTVTVVVPIAFALTAIVRALRGTDAPGTDELWHTLDNLGTRIGINPGELRPMIQSKLQEASAALLRGSLSAASAAGGGVIQFIVAMGAFHFSLLNGEWLHEQIVVHSPLGRPRTQTLLSTTESVVRTSFYGIVAVAVAQGALLGIGAWIAGLPAPALWGLVAAVTSFLPFVGSALVWIPGSILLLAQGKIGMGIFFLAWGAGLVANIDNLVRPMIVMSTLPVSGLLVFVSLLGGMQAFGLLGLFVGPVTLAIGEALLRMLREELENGHAPEHLR